MSRAASLARSAGLAPASARWHLNALGQAGVLRIAELPGSARYFAAGTVESPTRDKLLALRAPHAIEVLAAVSRSPGLTLKELAAETSASPQAVLRARTGLVATGFVETVRDGRYTRAYPGGGLSGFVASRSGELPALFTHLEGALRAAGESVSVARRSREEIVFQVGRRGARREFRLKAASALTPN